MSDAPRPWWARLWARLFRRGSRRRLPGAAPLALPAPETEPAPVSADPSSVGDPWLDQLIAAVGEDKRLDEIGGDEFFARIDAMWAQGDERDAVEHIAKFIAAPATPADTALSLRRQLVIRLDELGDLAAALTHLEVLSEREDDAVRAHYLLGEHYRQRGDEVRALRHYEAVLARDMEYPNVRGRVQRLRAARGETGAAALGATIAGVDPGVAAAGARYRLIRELGRGATGVVYLARDGELARDVAVKLLHPHLAASDRADACARFFEEARISASLRHPNIIAVLDLDERARRIVMELAAGGTLQRVLRERGPRTVRRALERHAQILSALAAAHRHGIVHRDVKPGNLMFRRDPDAPGAEIALGDFGIAHLPGADQAIQSDAQGSAPGAEGTLAYMAPEQRRGAPGARSDVYAAGVVLFEMLTGRVPWSRADMLAGSRKADDFRLPDDVAAACDGPLARDLQAHMLALGAPAQDERPAAADARDEARSLRDRAIAADAG